MELLFICSVSFNLGCVIFLSCTHCAYSTNLTIVTVTIIILIIIIVIAVLTLIVFTSDITSSNRYYSSASVGQALSHVLSQALPNLDVSADKVSCITHSKPKVEEDTYCTFKIFSVLSSEALNCQSFCRSRVIVR